jgi:hypothetical protein
MGIPEKHKEAMISLRDAFAEGRVSLVEAKSASTGEPVYVICRVFSPDGKYLSFVPMARLFNGDPVEEVLPPETEEKKEHLQ